jgi:SNF2 family DNA or RNA helicase
LANLRPQQLAALPHLLNNKRCALWLAMGGGKTLVELTAFDTLATLGVVYRELIVAPLRVARDVWPSAVAQFMPHLSCRFLGGDVLSRATNLSDLPDICTINFELLPWLIKELDPWPFDSIVVDESSKLRGFRGSVQVSSRGKTFLRLGGAKRSGELARVAYKSRRFVELSGTPSPKGLDQLWGQLWFIDQGIRLGRTFEGFKQRYFSVHPCGFGLVPLPGAEAEIYAAISDVCLSIDLKQYMDVRQPVITDVMVDLPPLAKAKYKEMEKQFYTQLNSVELGAVQITALNAATKSMKLLQLSNGAAYHDDDGSWAWLHDAKLEALDSIIEEAGGPVIVVYQFKSDLHRIKQKYKHARVLKTALDEDDWNAGRIPLLLLHPAGGGHGLNLQHGGNVMVLFGLTWDLELYQQVIERIGPARQAQSGYDRLVYIYRIMARGTLDSVVAQRLETKCTIQDALLAAMC